MTTPSPAPIVAQQQYNEVKALLMQSESRIAAVLPSHLTPERMIRVALTTIQQNQKILLCSKLSILGTIVQASELGLELNGFLGEAYIVPFWNGKTRRLEAQFQAGYKGLISLARRSGLISLIKPVLVFHGDQFQIEEGTDPRIIHVPDYDLPTRGTIDKEGNMVGLRGAYAIVHYKDGTKDFEYLPVSRLDELRDMSKARDKDGNETGPWTSHPGEMYRKVPIRQLAKRLPLSPEFQKAAALDEYGEAGVRQNLGSIIEADSQFNDVLAGIAQQRTDELADKYVRPATAAPTSAPDPRRAIHPQPQSVAQSDAPPYDDHDIPGEYRSHTPRPARSRVGR
jgi:recombination protein RecT